MPIRRSYSDIKSDAKTRIQYNTPINEFGPTSITGAFIDIIASEMDSIYSEIEYLHRSIDPTRNFGRELDNLGYMLGVDRKSGNIAIDESQTNFYFYIDKKTNITSPKILIEALYPSNTHSNIIERLFKEGYINKIIDPDEIIIPKGVIISNNSGTINYITLEETRLTGNNNAYCGVAALSEGSSSNVESNVLIKHTLNNIGILNIISKYILCTNTFPIQTGGDSDSDANYKYRISLQPQIRNVNEQTIRSVCLDTPGVRNIYFTRSLYGYGTIGVILEGTSPLISEGLINIVTNRLEALSGNDAVFVSAPEYKGIELSISIIPEIGIDGNNLNDLVRDNIITYINNINIGGTIIWNDIIKTIMDVDGVKDFMVEYFKIGEYNPYKKLNTKPIVLRTINQRAYETEKFYTDKGLIKVCSVR